MQVLSKASTQRLIACKGLTQKNSSATSNPHTNPVTQALLFPIFQVRKLKLSNVHPIADK